MCTYDVLELSYCSFSYHNKNKAFCKEQVAYQTQEIVKRNQTTQYDYIYQLH